MTVTNHVSLTITKSTQTVSQAGFGIPLILTYHTVFPELTQRYGSLQEMVTAGFSTTSRTYQLASTIFAQNPRPAAVIAGRRSNAPLKDVEITPRANPLASTAYSIKVNDQTFTFTTDATPLVSEITAGLVALINAGTEDVLATDTGPGTSIQIEKADSPGGSATAGEVFTVEFDQKLFTIVDNTTDPGIVADLTAVVADNDDWYALVTDSTGAAEIAALAVYVETLTKLYMAETQDSDPSDSGTGISATLKTAAYERTSLWYSADNQPSLAAGVLGLWLPTTPGSSTVKFKTAAPVNPSTLNSAQVANLKDENANYYQTLFGVNFISSEAVFAGGEYLDVNRFIDWLEARITEAVINVYINNPKVPFTDSGIQLIVAAVEGVLREGISNGGINGDEELILNFPRASEVSAANKAARTLPDVEFQATLAGAVHKTIITGRVVL